MERVMFLKHSDALDNGRQWDYLKEQLENLKKQYKIGNQVYDAATEVIEWVDEYNNVNYSEYIEHLNKVRSLIGKHRKVSRLINTCVRFLMTNMPLKCWHTVSVS